eukprot:tig00000139_g8300.t1
MTDEERKSDRATVESTLRTIKALGYEIKLNRDVKAVFGVTRRDFNPLNWKAKPKKAAHPPPPAAMEDRPRLQQPLPVTDPNHVTLQVDREPARSAGPYVRSAITNMPAKVNM